MSRLAHWWAIKIVTIEVLEFPGVVEPLIFLFHFNFPDLGVLCFLICLESEIALGMGNAERGWGFRGGVCRCLCQLGGECDKYCSIGSGGVCVCQN